MACPGNGPCTAYPIDLSCCLNVSGAFPDACLNDGTPVDQAVINNAILVSSQLLWALTGRQFGTCSVTLRPCRNCDDECCLPDFGVDNIGYSTGGGYPFYPVHLANGDWVNFSCSCQDNCSCTNLCEVRLPYPVCSVDEVLVDGIIQDPSSYKVLNFERLVRVPSVSGDCWPRCNDLTKDDTEEGTWSVTLTYGRPVPDLVLFGAAQMACEIIKDCVGKPCNLPKRVSSVTRQGVSISFLDTMDFLDKGLTGLYYVDLAARTYNPNKLTRKSTVYSPDYKGKWNIES